MGYIGGSGSPSPVSLPDRTFARSNTRSKTRRVNRHESSPCRCHPTGRVGPRRDTHPPRRGSPVLSHPATVPPQMPLRALVSQSETISAPGQCRTLRRGLEAVYGPYSTSAPCARHSTLKHDRTRSTTEVRTSTLARVARATRVAILTALTRQKSHSTRPFSTAKEIGCYRQRGGGRGCDPARPSFGRAPLDLSTGNQRYGVVNEPFSGPVGPCYPVLLSINKYRSIPYPGQSLRLS